MTPSSGTDTSADLPSISLFFCRLLHLGRVGEAQDGGKRAPLQNASLARKITSTRPVHLPQGEWLVCCDWLVARWPNEWAKGKRETNGWERFRPDQTHEPTFSWFKSYDERLLQRWGEEATASLSHVSISLAPFRRFLCPRYIVMYPKGRPPCPRSSTDGALAPPNREEQQSLYVCGVLTLISRDLFLVWAAQRTRRDSSPPQLYPV